MKQESAEPLHYEPRNHQCFQERLSPLVPPTQKAASEEANERDPEAEERKDDSETFHCQKEKQYSNLNLL